MADKRITYARALAWCGSATLVGLIAQHLWLDWRTAGSTVSMILLGALAAGALGWVGVMAWREKRALVTFLISIPYTVTVISYLTVLTILGTLVLQRIQPARFDEIYGAAANPLRFLFLEDLFHSFWFMSIVVLTCVSLFFLAVRRWPWTWKRVGYAMAHLGIVIGLVGAGIGSATSVRGRLDAEVGQVSSTFLVDDWRSGRRTPTQMPFEVRLDKFHIDEYSPVYRLYVFRHVDGSSDRNDYRPLVALDPEERLNKTVDLGDGVSVRIDAYQAEGKKAAASSGPLHTLSLDGKGYAVEPGKTYPDLGGYHVTVSEFFHHFTIDTSTRSVANASSEAKNPALKVTVRKGGAEGAVAYEGWLFANMPGFSMDHSKGDDDSPKWVPIYVYGGSEASEGPSARITVLEGGTTRTYDLVLDEEKSFFSAAGGKLVGAFRVRDKEAKNYYSTLSILKDGATLAAKQIYVNEPLFYQGWAFYQSNYDPNNLRYSGIEVVRDPGLPLVYVGLTLMMLGVFHIFYLRTLRRKAKEVAA